MVESIANGDSHVPFRDSKLTMLLQVNLDHFQLDELRILVKIVSNLTDRIVCYVSCFFFFLLFQGFL